MAVSAANGGGAEQEWQCGLIDVVTRFPELQNPHKIRGVFDVKSNQRIMDGFNPNLGAVMFTYNDGRLVFNYDDTEITLRFDPQQPQTPTTYSAQDDRCGRPGGTRMDEEEKASWAKLLEVLQHVTKTQSASRPCVWASRQVQGLADNSLQLGQPFDHHDGTFSHLRLINEDIGRYVLISD